MKLEFSWYIFEKCWYRFSWKPVQWEPSCSMQTRGQIGMTTLVIAFRNFTNVPKNFYQVVFSQSNGGCIVWKKVWESYKRAKRKMGKKMEKETRKEGQWKTW